MTDFVLLYSGGKMPETESEQQAVVKEWEAWYGKIGAAVGDRTDQPHDRISEGVQVTPSRVRRVP